MKQTLPTAIGQEGQRDRATGHVDSRIRLMGQEGLGILGPGGTSQAVFWQRCGDVNLVLPDLVARCLTLPESCREYQRVHALRPWNRTPELARMKTARDPVI